MSQHIAQWMADVHRLILGCAWWLAPTLLTLQRHCLLPFSDASGLERVREWGLGEVIAVVPDSCAWKWVAVSPRRSPSIWPFPMQLLKLFAEVPKEVTEE